MSEIIEPQEISVMSLNGDGTQENPYQITTVAEFRSMNDATAYFKLMNDLDVNDSAWATGWTDATMNFKEFDGDGFEIRNINYNGTGIAITVSTSNATVKRTNFNNFISTGSASCIRNTASNNLYFNECNFAFDVNTNHIFDVASSTSYVVFNRCAFTLSGVVLKQFNRLAYGGNMMTNCHVNLSNLKLPNAISGSQELAFINLNATRVSVTGSAIKDVTGTVRWFASANHCFVAVDMADSLYKPTIFSNSNPTSPCFYDKDLMGETLTVQTNVHALTTAQCKNKDYLNSIGFVVI